MQYNKKMKLVSLDDVNEFFHHLVDERRVNVHPDDSFEDYVSEDGDTPFSQEECAVYNRLMGESFDICEKNGADIYAIGLEYVQKNFA